jgi:hypothetical protein
MWVKLLIVLIIIALLALVWWNTSTKNIAYFDGNTTFQIPSPLFTKGRQDRLDIALKFPKDGAKNGIMLFMRAGNNFQIVYVQDNKLIVNNNNDETQSVIIGPDLEANVKSQKWVIFEFLIRDEFKDTPIYFGGAPSDQIPINTLVFEGQSATIQFPKSGLKACTNYCYLNNVNLSTMFQKQGLRTYC